ncbi:DUF771 domain-containing protein [Enterococcus sp. FDAARGOS_553]|uniref:DUF771 domain-containing protein n=1 Tax=Enterococcus TaxID=1350 RepID=UPI000F4D320A|nr:MULTISPECIES: DUF771 domain-containing protein [Enterococcus]AYY08849.1 DUF771 domain-containing protein [Enterococcus sp. FDAARGOS_553]
MQQFLEAKILVPEDYVIISRVEYEELLQANNLGRWMTLKEVLDRINRKYDWFSQKVLKNPRYRNRIDISKSSEGFVYYPGEGNDKYLFLKSKTLEFLEENFADILKEKR